MTQRQKVWWSVARSDFAGGRCIESGSLCILVNPTLTLPNLGEGILISPPRPGEIQRGLISVLCAKARHRLPDRLFATPSIMTGEDAGPTPDTPPGCWVPPTLGQLRTSLHAQSTSPTPAEALSASAKDARTFAWSRMHARA